MASIIEKLQLRARAREEQARAAEKLRLEKAAIEAAQKKSKEDALALAKAARREERKRRKKAKVSSKSAEQKVADKSVDNNTSKDITQTPSTSGGTIFASMQLMRKHAGTQHVPVLVKEEEKKSVSKVDKVETSCIDFDTPAIELAKLWSLHPALQKAIEVCGPSLFFPVQVRVMPILLGSAVATGAQGIGAARRLRDVCISAPTGSGKTLAYVIPVLNSLINRVVPRVRALVVLPTRDLAIQVYTTFQEWIGKISRVSPDIVAPRVGLVTGQRSFVAEQAEIVDQETGESLIDILVATPGRLLEHLRLGENTNETSLSKNVSLQHLRFLIVDEADRLLAQSYEGWVHDVCRLAMKKEVGSMEMKRDGAFVMSAGTVHQNSGNERVPFIRILLSATLTSNPQKLAALQLTAPIHIAVSAANASAEAIARSRRNKEKFSIPKELSEFMQVCTNAEKPLVLLQLLMQLKERRRQTIVFTASVDATHRLARLLQILECEGLNVGGVTEFSGRVPQHQRTRSIQKFRAGKIAVLICSDSFARGIDVSSVDYVINYDVPSQFRTYIHRCGRTARAGRHGQCYSLLRGDQVKHFRRMLDQAERIEGRGLIEGTPGFAADFDISSGRLRPAGLGPSREEKETEKAKAREERLQYSDAYLKSLENLKELLELEAKEKVSPGTVIEKALDCYKSKKRKREQE
eukprot:g5032.t1